MKDKHGIDWIDMEITVRFPPEPPPPEEEGVLTIVPSFEVTPELLEWYESVTERK